MTWIRRPSKQLIRRFASEVVLEVWMEEILHHFLGLQFIGQAAMSLHPRFNIGR